MRNHIFWLFAVFTANWFVARDDSNGDWPTIAELGRRAEIIKPSAGELKWQQIPWATDLAEAQVAARAERRPLFLWVTGDDPLERC